MNLKLTSDDIRRFPHIAGLSPKTSKLIERLKEMHPGDSLTDDEMSAIAGGKTEVGGEAYTNLKSACNYVMRHFGLVIQRVHGAGCVKCLDGTETVVSVERGREHIGRSVRRQSLVLKQVDVAALEPDKKTAALVLRAQLGALASYSSTSTAKRLASNVDLDKWQNQQRKMLKAM